MGEVTEADVRGLARQLVDDLPPDEVDQYRFRGAQFDRGLAYVQFPEGHGGLGLASRKLQTVVDAELRGAGVPYHDLAINPIGIGMGAPEPILVDLAGRDVVHQLAGHSPDIGFGDLTHRCSQRSTSTAKQTYQRPGSR